MAYSWATVTHLKYVLAPSGRNFTTKFLWFFLASTSEFTTDLANSVSFSVRATASNSTYLPVVNRYKPALYNTKLFT